MKLSRKTLVLLSSSLLWSSATLADALQLESRDIKHGEFMHAKHEFNGFGCIGSNSSPQLSWHNIPKGTEAFAITVYDPDAPTGSGWWHWQLVNIPKHVTTLASGAGKPDSKTLPKGSIQIENDYGIAGFGGACPPVGDGIHRYQFTVHALSRKLDLPQGASGALAGYMINAYSLASSTIETIYKR